MLVRQSLLVTSGTPILEAHAAALRTICQVSWRGKPEEVENDLKKSFKSSNSSKALCRWKVAVACCCSSSWLMFAQVLTKSPAPEVTKEPTRPLPSSASSTSSRTSMDEGGSESGSPASLSTKQLVYIAADIQKLQEQVLARKLITCICICNYNLLT